jgi:hypothetical protein
MEQWTNQRRKTMGNIYIPGGDDSCGGNCGGNCGGGCGGIPVIGGARELFRPGDMIKMKLTDEVVMVLKAEADDPITYIVRTKTYQMVQLFEFEVEAIEESE